MNDQSQSVHPIFRDRPDSNAKIWRYLDIAKFIALLETKSIHFTRIDQFDDHFEGEWPKSDLRYFNASKSNLTKEVFRPDRMAVSCWNENKHESAAMWGLYAAGNQGLAIATTYGQLETITIRCKPTYVLADAARVQYIDHINEGMITDGRLPNILWPYMHKNISYSHEREVRALLMVNYDCEIYPKGIDVEIDVSLFVNEVIISPTAEEWFCTAIKGLLKKYGLEDKYRESSLSKRTFYMTDSEQGEK